MKNSYFDKFRQIIKLSVPMAALFMSAVFYTACSDPDEYVLEKPTPEKPVTPTDPEKPTEKTSYDFYLNSVADFQAKADSIEMISNKPEWSANAIVGKDIPSDTKDLDGAVGTVVAATEKSNVSLNWQNSKLVPAQKGSGAYTEKAAKALSKSPIGQNNGIYFTVSNEFVYMFDASKLNLINQGQTNGQEQMYVITCMNTFKEAIDGASIFKDDPRVTKVTFSFQGNVTGNIGFTTGSEVFMRDVEYTKVERQGNKQVATGNSKFVLELHDGVKIKLTTGKSTVMSDGPFLRMAAWPFEELIEADLYSGKRSAMTIVAHGSYIFHAGRSAATAEKSKKTHKKLVYNFTDGTKLINPDFAQYKDLGVNGIPKIDKYGNEVKYVGKLGPEIDYDTNNGRSGEYLMRAAGLVYERVEVGSSSPIRLGNWTPIIENSENLQVYIYFSPNDHFLNTHNNVEYFTIGKVNDGCLHQTLGVKHKSNAQITLGPPTANLWVHVAYEDIVKYKHGTTTDALKYFNDNNVYLNNPNGKFFLFFDEKVGMNRAFAAFDAAALMRRQK